MLFFFQNFLAVSNAVLNVLQLGLVTMKNLLIVNFLKINDYLIVNFS